MSHLSNRFHNTPTAGLSRQASTISRSICLELWVAAAAIIVESEAELGMATAETVLGMAAAAPAVAASAGRRNAPATTAVLATAVTPSTAAPVHNHVLFIWFWRSNEPTK